MNSAARVRGLRDRLAAETCGALAVTDPVNVAYLTGFENVFDEEQAHVALVTEDSLELFTDGRYAEAASRAASETEWRVRVLTSGLLEAVCGRAAELGLSAMAVEDTIAQGRFSMFERSFGGRIVASHEWVEQLRKVKESDEIERIAAAQELTDRAFVHILDFVAVGRSEREIALELEFYMRRNGSDGVAFAPIVASGPNSALPHAKVTDRVLEQGDFLKLDFGARVRGYCADMTRTVVIGRASDRQREFYSAVLAANHAGNAAVRAGAAGRDVDAAARAAIEQAGLGGLFTHGLGHGVGREVHELPGVGPRSEQTLPCDSVITIEPGVYEPGFGGVRIEDLVVVQEGSGRILTRSTKDLIEL